MHKLDVFHFLGLVSLITIFCVTFLSFFGSSHYLFDLLTHFHLQYAIGCLVLMGFFLIQKKPLLVFIATIGFIMQFIFLLPYYFQPTASATDQTKTETIRVYFNNINYGTTDFTSLTKSIAHNHPQVVGIAELSSEKFEHLKNQLPNYPYNFHVPGRGQLGLAIFSQIPFVDQPSVRFFSDNRFPSIVASIQDFQTTKKLTIIVIHPPPPLLAEYATIRNELFSNLAEFVKTQSDPLLIMGDFNSSSWSPAFQTLLGDSSLVDSRNNQGVQPSWPSQLPNFLRIPIDHILTNELLPVTYREVLLSVGSDHLPILADFAW